MKEKREKRLEKEFRKLIYELLTTRIKNPLITEMFSVTEVKISPELDVAEVYLSVFGTNKERVEETYNAICASSGDLRRELGREMHIRIVPRLIFKRDTSGEYGEKIDKIIAGFTYGDSDDDK